jgi:hypothetical protein
MNLCDLAPSTIKAADVVRNNRRILAYVYLPSVSERVSSPKCSAADDDNHLCIFYGENI